MGTLVTLVLIYISERVSRVVLCVPVDVSGVWGLECGITDGMELRKLMRWVLL